MSRKYSKRRSSWLARRWHGVLWRWRLSEKTGLVLAGLAGAVATAFGLLLNSLHTAKVEQQDLACLARNIYFEARGEPRAGQYAVAEVTMNRVASARYPNDVCGVVYQKNWDALRKRYVSAFSWTEFRSVPEPEGKQWRQAWQIAQEVYYRRNEPKLGNALHYHADYIKPSWSRKQTPLARIGNHVFYR